MRTPGVDETASPRGRRSIRLKSYDYTSPGAYFVTVCAYRMQCLFATVEVGAVKLSEVGRIVEEEWLRTAKVRQGVELDTFVVMPNHVHGILLIEGWASTGTTEWATHRVAPTRRSAGPVAGSVPAIVGQFKSAAARRINALRGTPWAHVWQRNYYEHVIRSEIELNRVREYIAGNPLLWSEDEYNPEPW